MKFSAAVLRLAAVATRLQSNGARRYATCLDHFVDTDEAWKDVVEDALIGHFDDWKSLPRWEHLSEVPSFLTSVNPESFSDLAKM